MTKEEILGKSVIGALEICNKDNELVEIVELAGQIIEISEDKGIIICNHDSKKAIGLPVNYDAFKVAEKGYYTLTTGAKVKNPDLTCLMRIIKN